MDGDGEIMVDDKRRRVGGSTCIERGVLELEAEAGRETSLYTEDSKCSMYWDMFNDGKICMEREREGNRWMRERRYEQGDGDEYDEGVGEIDGGV